MYSGFSAYLRRRCPDVLSFVDEQSTQTLSTRLVLRNSVSRFHVLLKSVDLPEKSRNCREFGTFLRLQQSR